jgi:very-short-patch-repair endonuclease
MSRPVQPPAASLIGQPLSYRQAREIESAKRLRSAVYRRPTRGVVVAVDDDPARRQEPGHGDAIQVFRAALGPDAVLGGPSAAWALGVRWASARDQVEVVLPAARRVRAREGLRVRGDRLRPGEIVRTPYGLATSPARTAFDLARCGRPERALAWVDAMLRQTAIGVSDVQEVIGRHLRLRGRRQAERVVPLADPRAESPRESMLRWVLLDAGFPAPTPQYVVRDDLGRFVARLDLAWETIKLGVEYDGAHHRESGQHSRDLARHNRLRALGWVVIQIDAAQLRNPEAMIVLLRGLLSR